MSRTDCESDLNSDDQDKVIYFCFKNDGFISKCIRKGIDASLFTSDIRKKTYNILVDFFNRYKRSPGYDIISVIEEEIDRGKFIKDVDIAPFGDYMLSILALDFSDDSCSYLIDRLDNFIIRRTAITSARAVAKLVSNQKIDANSIMEIMRDAVEKISKNVGNYSVDDILSDSSDKEDNDIVTKFNISNIDQALGGGIRRGQFTVILGYTNKGKSWSVVHLAKMAARLGRNTLIVAIEMSNKLLKKRLKMTLTGKKEHELNTSIEETREMIKTSLVKKSNIFIMNDEEKNMNIDSIGNVVEEIKQKTGKDIDLILFDSADDAMPPKNGEQYKTKIDKSTAIYTYLKNYAKDSNISVVTTSQAQRRGGKVIWLTAEHVGDDINKIRKATISISINATDEESKKRLARIYVFKQTDGPVGAKAWVATGFEIGQFCISNGKFNQQEFSELLKNVPNYDSRRQ